MALCNAIQLLKSVTVLLGAPAGIAGRGGLADEP
jgi:hypothetical protein